MPELKGSLVAGSFLPTGFEARIFLEEGRTLCIEPEVEAFRRGDRESFLVYDLQDATDGGWQCDGAVALGSSPDSQASTQGSGCGGDHCRTELALDLDYAFYEFAASSFPNSVAMAENIINIVNVSYERDAGIRHEITTIIVRTRLSTEPTGYASSTGTGDFLTAMQNHWNANHTSIARDVAHAITARHTGGTAYIYSPGNGVICESSNAYGVSGSALDPYSRWIANGMAHELGHNWGADHCSCQDPAYIMNPTYPPCPLRFNPADSLPDIASERASVACLEAGALGDDFADALVVTSGTFYLGSTVGVTIDGTLSCGLSSVSPDVWFRYTLMSSGSAGFATCGDTTDYDTVIGIFG